MIEINAIKISNNESIDNTLLNFISEDKKNELKKFKSYMAFQHSLYSEIIKRFILEVKLNLEYNNIILNKNKYGKPSIINNPIHFNISHSKDWIVFALDKDMIGIDIEFIKPIDFSIAKRYFSSEEYERMIFLDENSKIEYFYNIWTLKESCIKAIGQGLSLPLNSFSIILDNNKNIILKSKFKKEYFFKQYFIDKDYKLSVCANNNLFPDNINFLDINYITSFFSKI